MKSWFGNLKYSRRNSKIFSLIFQSLVSSFPYKKEVQKFHPFMSIASTLLYDRTAIEKKAPGKSVPTIKCHKNVGRSPGLAKNSQTIQLYESLKHCISRHRFIYIFSILIACCISMNIPRALRNQTIQRSAYSWLYPSCSYYYSLFPDLYLYG